MEYQIAELKKFLQEIHGNCDGTDESFLKYCEDNLGRFAGIDVWGIVASIAAGITGSSGLAYRVGNKLLPITAVGDDMPYALSFVFTGVEKGRFNTSEFMELVNKVDNQTETDVATSRFSMGMLVLSGECRFKRYLISKNLPGSVDRKNIKSECKISSVGESSYSAGMFIGRNRLRNIISFDDSSKSIMLAVTYYGAQSEFQYVFGKHDGAIRSIVDFDVKDSRKIKAARVVYEYSERPDKCVAERLLEDSHHVMRWLALKMLIKSDPENTSLYLRRGSRDRNEEISDICMNALADIERRGHDCIL